MHTRHRSDRPSGHRPTVVTGPPPRGRLSRPRTAWQLRYARSPRWRTAVRSSLSSISSVGRHRASGREPLLALAGVTDVLVNGPDDVSVDRGRRLEKSAVRFHDEVSLRGLAQRLAAQAGRRRLDESEPYNCCWTPYAPPR